MKTSRFSPEDFILSGVSSASSEYHGKEQLKLSVEIASSSTSVKQTGFFGQLAKFSLDGATRNTWNETLHDNFEYFVLQLLRERLILTCFRDVQSSCIIRHDIMIRKMYS